MGPARGSAVVSQDVASSLVLERGSTVELQSSAYNASSGREIRFTNLTVEGILSPPAGWEQPTFTFGLATTSFVLVPLRDSAWLEAQLAGRTTDFATVEVYIDRASLNPYDIEASRRYIARLERDLQQAAAPYGGNVFGSVLLILDNVALAQGVLRGLFLAFAGPIIVLGLYVGAIGVDLAHSERRRHLAILKTRGASPRQILRLLLLEALVGGVLAAGLGLLVGAGISRVLVGSISTLFDWDVGAGEIAISWTTVLLTVLFATAFMFLVSYRSAKRTARSPVVETLRFHVPGETRVAYRPPKDLEHRCHPRPRPRLWHHELVHAPGRHRMGESQGAGDPRGGPVRRPTGRGWGLHGKPLRPEGGHGHNRGADPGGRGSIFLPGRGGRVRSRELLRGHEARALVLRRQRGGRNRARDPLDPRTGSRVANLPR